MRDAYNPIGEKSVALLAFGSVDNLSKILDRLDDAVDVGEHVDDLITQKVIACLQPLLDGSQADQFKDDFDGRFHRRYRIGINHRCILIGYHL
jgi:hypothetical protein